MDKDKQEDTVETKSVTFVPENGYFELENGETLGKATIAYETYGGLNREKSNAILILHALSGDAHAAGFHKNDTKPGWWNAMIGKGKAFDTGKYFVICSNILGGCKGSTGPWSINRETGRPYGLNFPAITIGDIVFFQKKLIDYLGIRKLLCIAGGSMGGMQVLQWLIKYPELVSGAIPIATAMRHSPQQIAFSEVGRQAIMYDPDWKGGDYYNGPAPSKGLALARMIGHITYMSDTSMTQKFGRLRKQGIKKYSFKTDFEVEGYLQYRGDSFVKRFDANSYLYITKAMDNFDAEENNSLIKSLSGRDIRVLVISFKSDWLYPTYQSKEIVKACKIAGVRATFCEIYSQAGHDAFLLEIDEQQHLITHFLNKITREKNEKTDNRTE